MARHYLDENCGGRLLLPGSKLLARKSIYRSGVMDARQWIQWATTATDGLEPVSDEGETDGPTARYLILDQDSGVRVREATEKDASDIAAIGRRAFHHAFFGVLDLSSLTRVAGRFDVATLRREIRESSSRYLLGIWESNLVGFAQLRPGSSPPSMLDGPALELHGLYVAPDWARRGVGSALVRGASAHARDLGFESLWCAALEANRGAVHFFRSRGFRCVRRERVVIGKRRRVRLILSRLVAVEPTARGTGNGNPPAAGRA